jgi:hypothetical protein
MGVLAVRAVVQSPVGVQAVTASGLRRGDLATAVPVSTDVEVVEHVRDMLYLQTGLGEFEGVRLETSDGTVPTPAQLFDMRTVGGSGAPKLALLGLDGEEAGGATHVIAWDHEAGRAAVAATLEPGAHGLSAATSATALVNSFVGPQFEPAAFVVRLDDARPPVAFLGDSLWSFTVLEPSYLYDTETARFYRLRAPLQRTALPAPLAGSAGAEGDFHALRLP